VLTTCLDECKYIWLTINVFLIHTDNHETVSPLFIVYTAFYYYYAICFVLSNSF